MSSADYDTLFRILVVDRLRAAADATTAAKYEPFYRLMEMPPDNPLTAARRRDIVLRQLARMPDIWNELIEEGIEKGIETGRLKEVRAMLRRVLAARRLALGADDEARIEACTELLVVKRWFDQALVATTTAEALR
jgi:hypothetical protein